MTMAAGFTDAEIRQVLNKWRHDVLAWLGREMLDASEDFREAEEMLAVAHRSPGILDAETIDSLWDRLNAKSVLLRRLERTVQRIEEMDLPHLIVLFQRTTRKKTYKWEGAAWQLPETF